MSKPIHVLAAAAAAVLLIATPVYAAENPPPAGNGATGQAEKAFRESAQKFLQALQLLINAIPQYEAPEMLPNGDILIRRKHPEAPPPAAKPAPPRSDRSAI